MAKPNDSTPDGEPETPWGTWEDLLLACAVNRFGTKSWDSVAIEIQKRSSAHHLLTPDLCKRKYDALRRRFTAKNGDASGPPDVIDKEGDKAGTATVPWLDDLRKLRVAELKRELERYDLSIVSLQLKVERLKEEREQSEKSDLEKNAKRESEEGDRREGDDEPKKLSSESVAGKPVSGEESDRDDQSVNKFNSTEGERENLEPEPEPDQTEEEESDRARGKPKLVREDSCNGSSDSIEKQVATESVKVETESPELLESVAESAKENSDVQSSASLSRKNGRSKVVAVGCSSGEEPENDNQSPTVKVVSAKSQPLIDFLQIVRSHKLGSIFERRLHSQETSKYRNLIKQHVDLETVQSRLDKGCYSGRNNNPRFFRDLLLLINNAIVFFGKKSSESTAAIELRRLVSKEMLSQKKRNPKKLELSMEQPQTSSPLPSKQDLEPSSNSPLLKRKLSSGPIIVCRKRSSIAVKTDKKREKTSSSAEEEDSKQPETSSFDEEHRIPKKRSRDSFGSGARNLKKIAESRTTTNPSSKKNLEAKEAKIEKNKQQQQQGAANFLNRMKRNSSVIDDKVKSSGDKVKSSGDKFRGGDEKGRKEQAASSSRRMSVSGGRQVKVEDEEGSPAKKTVGRPPKRAAAPPQSTVSGKRSRPEGGENDATAAASRQQQKKRSRR